eukprot:CAMPEP_0175222420 /NCGR_PEP_ID=MMETSP0093-20121207/20815_1 /TAXON_ID=311494 /ORGANISM="Alexandrium monilatum, Strain CCMP3105" /LENGTH=198 /DNA_ID=CAMNT_0016516007 /DNA_START=47 /DNA_END=640 /DNA_ORIENTATION=+
MTWSTMCSKPGGGQKGHVGLVRQVVLRQRHDVVAEVRRDDMLRRDARNVWGAAKPHDHLQLVLQHVHHAHDATVAVGRQGIKYRTANAASLRAQGHRLEDISTAADPTVDEDGKVLLGGARLLQRLRDLRQDLNARSAGVELPAAVVGQHTAREAGLVGHDGILPALNSLQQHLHLGDALEPRHVLPAEAWVDVAADG